MKQMSGAQEIELLIKGDNAAVQEVLTQIAEVEKCIPLEQKEEACVHLNLIAKPGMDIREQVFASCVNHGFVILQMNPVSKSLEDVFLELTEGEKKTSNGQKKSDWKPVEETTEEQKEASEPEKVSDEKEGDQS